MGLELVALVFMSIFAGICVYVAIVEHPARLATDTAAAPAIIAADFAITAL